MLVVEARSRNLRGDRLKDLVYRREEEDVESNPRSARAIISDGQGRARVRLGRERGLACLPIETGLPHAASALARRARRLSHALSDLSYTYANDTCTMNIYIYIYILYTYVCVYVYIYMYAHLSLSIHIYIYTHVRTCICILICICIGICICICICICI